MAPMKVTAISSRAKLPVRGAAPAAAKPAGLASKMSAAVIATTGAVVAHPLAAEAAVTPSLKNLLNSVLAGGVVLFGIFGAISVIAKFDTIER